MPPLRPQTTPELEVTGECGWLPGRAVSMATEVPVEQKVAGVLGVVPPLVTGCLRLPWAQPAPLWSGSAHDHPDSSLPLILDSTFDQYPEADYSLSPPLSLLLSMPWSPVTWITAGAFCPLLTIRCVLPPLQTMQHLGTFPVWKPHCLP